MPTIKVTLGRFDTAWEATTSFRPSSPGLDPIVSVIDYSEEVEAEPATFDEFLRLFRDSLESMSHKGTDSEPITLGDLWPRSS